MLAIQRRFISASSTLLLVLMMLSTRDASAFSGITNLVYIGSQDQLQGFSATNKDVGDLNATEVCTEYVPDEAGDYFCVATLYVEYWVSVTAQLFNQQSGVPVLHYSGHSRDFLAAVNEYSMPPPPPNGYFSDFRAHGIYYVEQDIYFGNSDGSGFWFYTYAGTNVYQLGEADKIEHVIPYCSLATVDSGVINEILQWPAKEPFERAATIGCMGPNLVTVFDFNDSFGKIYPYMPFTNDPCKTTVYLSLIGQGIVGGMHKHPYFQSPDEYTAGLGCFQDKRSPTISQLDQLNIMNQDFSDNDKNAFRGSSPAAGWPFYLRVPTGSAVKRFLSNTTTGVWP